jgi:hypothetical protein
MGTKKSTPLWGVRTGSNNKVISGILTVKILIGIYQTQEDITRFHRDRMLDITSLTKVGPFFSKSQAHSWMKELHDQIENSEVAHIPENELENLKWYGFTFEE